VKNWQLFVTDSDHNYDSFEWLWGSEELD